MNRKVFCLMVAALGGVFLAATAWAQNSTGTIEATGTQRVRVQPQAIRLVYEIQASGKTAEEAIQKLQAQRETTSEKLKELGADENSIHYTPASLARDMGVTTYTPSQVNPGVPQFYPSTSGFSSPGMPVAPNSPALSPAYPPPGSIPPVIGPSAASPGYAPMATPFRPGSTSPVDPSPTGTTPRAVPAPLTPPGGDSVPSTPSQPDPAPSLSPRMAGAATAPRTYAAAVPTLPPPSQPVAAPAIAPAIGSYGMSSVAQAATTTPPYSSAPPASTSSSSGDDASVPPLPAPAQVGMPQPPFPRDPSGVSNGSEGEPGSGPAQQVFPTTPYSPVPVVVNFVARTTLTAQWPINASKPDDIALNVEKLRDKLVVAKLCGDFATGMPAVQPAIAPAAPMPALTRYAPAVQNDGLQLVCVGKLTKFDRSHALADAMAKAKQHAAELAEAAGCHLGSLATVSGTLPDDSDSGSVERVLPAPDDGGFGTAELPEIEFSVTLQFHIAP